MSRTHTIPGPQHVGVLEQTMPRPVGVALREATGDPRIARAVGRMAQRLGLEVEGDEGRATALRLAIDPELAESAYVLRLDAEGIHLRGGDAAGCFHGLQTLEQLLLDPTDQPSHAIAGIEIEDAPAYRWRGMMVDSARYFQPMPLLRDLIDRLARLKFNVMHWHVVDDQAWRLELDAHPELVRQTAGQSMGDAQAGGWYTKADVRDLIDYAHERFIEIVPEIEMPGHCRSVLHVHPELSCRGEQLPIPHVQGICDDIYCAGNDAVFTFLQSVLDEVVELFPSAFIHIGGDEARKTRWEACPRCQARMREVGLTDERQLQGWFITRMADHLRQHGRRIIGWDELGNLDLPTDAIIQWWRNIKPDAPSWPSQWAQRGHDAIFSPTSHVYLDYDYEKLPTEQTLTLRLERDPQLIDAQTAGTHFLGGECNVWTERMPPAKFESMVFPRAYCFIEALWSGDQRRDWPAMQEAIAAQSFAPLRTNAAG